MIFELFTKIILAGNSNLSLSEIFSSVLCQLNSFSVNSLAETASEAIAEWRDKQTTMLLITVHFIFSHRSLGKLKDLVAEHLDHVHYLNDILCLRIENLNEVLTGHLLNRLFIPLYVYSLVRIPTPKSSKSATTLEVNTKKHHAHQKNGGNFPVWFFKRTLSPSQFVSCSL